MQPSETTDWRWLRLRGYLRQWLTPHQFEIAMDCLEWRNAVAEQLNTLLTRAKYCADTTTDESDKDVERATLAIVERVATFEHIRARSSSVPVGEQK